MKFSEEKNINWRELGVGLSIEEDTQHVIWSIRESSTSVGKQKDQPKIQVNLDF